MREELKVFENRSDDWLAKERAYEARISAWDLDDGKYLKEEHHINHVNKDIKNQEFKNISNSYSRKETKRLDNKQILKIKLIIIGMVVVLMLPFIFILVGDGFMMFEISPIIVFGIMIIITSNMANKAKRERR